MKNKKLYKSGEVLLYLSLTQIITGFVIFCSYESMKGKSIGILAPAIDALFFLLAVFLMTAGLLGTTSAIFAVKAAGQSGEKARIAQRLAVFFLILDAFGVPAILAFWFPLEVCGLVLIRGIVFFLCCRNIWNFRERKDQPDSNSASLAGLGTLECSENRNLPKSLEKENDMLEFEADLPDLPAERLEEE